MGRLFSALLLVVLSPVLVACALAIALCDGLPILYGDRRVGRGGRYFVLWMFRTMRRVAGPRITAANDTRITKPGAILRTYKLDELPQLWNVVRGDMNLVGPRPETPEFVDLNSPMWQEVLSVPPGITGAASVACFHEASQLAASSDPILFYRTHLLPEKLARESAWLHTRTFTTDARLLWQTVKGILRAGSSRR